MSSPKKIGVIIGSVRVVRIGDKVAEWVKKTVEAEDPATPVSLSLIDIRSFNLPAFDEAVLPAMVPAHGQFAHEHSKAWDAEIAKYDAYILVSAEWNYGIPGATKNAIDYLYHAWIGKPILIVSYGIHGGALASEQWKTVLEGMHLKVVETRPKFEFPGRNPEQNNMSPGVGAAMGGELLDSVAEDWTEKKADLVQGYKQLIEKLL